MNILTLPLASIEASTDRARDLEPAWAEGLSLLIEEQGLQQPIIVRAIEGEFRRYSLIAGLHRLEAHRLLGRDTIPAYLSSADSDDAARLEEVMENLGRYELIALDRCHHLHELKQIWERKYPQAKHGGDHGNQHTGGKSQSLALATDAPEVFGFARAVAEKIGLSASTIKAAVKIWTGLAPQTRHRLRGTDLARKQTELKALSELQSHIQAKVLDAIFDEAMPDVSNVAQALAYSAGSVVEASVEKQFNAVRSAFSKLPDAAFDMVVSAEADRVMAALKRLGRI